MTIELLPGADRKQVVKNLDEVLSDLSRVCAAHDPLNLYRGYCRWVLESVRLLRSGLSQAELDGLLMTRRYWALQVTPPGDGITLNLLIEQEMSERRDAIEHAKMGLLEAIRWWDEAGQLVVPDTGVFLRHKSKCDVLDWAKLLDWTSETITVVIPLVVLKQLDDNKRGEHIGYRAGASIAIVNRLFEGPSNPFSMAPILKSSDWSPETMREGRPRGEVRVRVLPERHGDRRAASADEEIIARAVDLMCWSGRKVRLVTFDTHVAFRGREAGLGVVKLGSDDLHEKAKPKPYSPEHGQD